MTTTMKLNVKGKRNITRPNEDVLGEKLEAAVSIIAKMNHFAKMMIEQGNGQIDHPASHLLNKSSYNNLNKLTLTLIGIKVYDWKLSHKNNNNSPAVQPCDGDKNNSAIQMATMLRDDRQAFHWACTQFKGQIEYEEHERDTHYDMKYCSK